MSNTEHYVQTDYGRVYAEVEGDPHAELVLLAAGGPGTSHDHYHPWFSRLLPDFRVCYLDYTGCGRSDRLENASDYSIQLFAHNIEAVSDHLQATTLSLIGLSFGGLPATEFALNNTSRVRRLVLSNAQVSAAGWQRTNIDGVNTELARLFPREWRQILELRSRGVTSLDQQYQSLLALVLPDLEWVDSWDHPPLNQPSHNHAFEPAVYQAIVGCDPEWEITGTLRGYNRSSDFKRLPRTLVLSGRYDRLTPPAIADEIHSALDPERRSLHILERSAHRPWAEEPDAYFDAVKRFLEPAPA